MSESTGKKRTRLRRMWYCLRSGADSRCSSRSSCSNESRNNRCKPQILGNAFCRGISAAPYAVFPTFLSALLGRQIARLTAVACWTNVILFASAESFTEVHSFDIASPRSSVYRGAVTPKKHRMR
uniref:Centromere protein M n=2 Tax=Parascaris univalens TaxID=6257 RepID=A0A915A2G6_PARUN